MSTKIGTTRIAMNRLLAPLLVIIPLAVAGNFLYILLTSKQGIFAGLGGFRPGFLLLAAALVFVPWLAQSARMLVWSRAFGRHLKPIQALDAAIGSDIGGAVTPTAIGGGYVKLAILNRYGFPAGEATLVTILGTLEDGLFFAFALPTAIAISKAWANEHVVMAARNVIAHWPLVAGIAAVLVTSMILIRQFWKKAALDNTTETTIDSPGPLLRWKKRIAKFKKDLTGAWDFVLRNGKSAFATNVVIAGAGWCCRYGAVSALALGLGFEVDPILFFLLQWVVFTTMTMIPTPGAVGGAEISFALIYNGLIPSAAIPALTGAWRLTTFYLPIIAGAFIIAARGLATVSGEQKIESSVVFEEVSR